MHRKILIIRLSSIGDIVLTTPVIRCLAQQQNAEIHFLVKKKFAEVISTNPHIKKIWTFENSIREIIDDLKAESFDGILDLHYNFRSILLSWLLQKPTLRFNKLNIQKWLISRFKWNYLPQKHLVDRYFDALKSWNVLNDGKGLDFFIHTKDVQFIQSLALPDNYVVGVLGATFYTKQIPVNKWIEILHSLDLPLVLLGGTTEKELAVKITSSSKNSAIDLSGHLSIGQSAEVIRKANFVITPDTGMMHIAAAFKKPLHVVWGNTIPQFGMYPFTGLEKTPIKYHEILNLSCRPCSKLGKKECPEKHFACMQTQIFNKQTLEI